MAVNLAPKFTTKVDERFSREALCQLVTNQDYDWSGVDTVKVYSIPTVPMGDYKRYGVNRYGNAPELQNEVQTMTIRKDRAYNFTIDKLNKNQTMMVMDAGRLFA